MMSYRVQRPITALINGNRYRVGEIISEEVLRSMKNPRSFSVYLKNGYLVPTMPDVPEAAVAVRERPVEAPAAPVVVQAESPAEIPAPPALPEAQAHAEKPAQRKATANHRPRGRPRTKK